MNGSRGREWWGSGKNENDTRAGEHESGEGKGKQERETEGGQTGPVKGSLCLTHA